MAPSVPNTLSVLRINKSNWGLGESMNDRSESVWRPTSGHSPHLWALECSAQYCVVPGGHIHGRVQHMFAFMQHLKCRYIFLQLETVRQQWKLIFARKLLVVIFDMYGNWVSPKIDKNKNSQCFITCSS